MKAFWAWLTKSRYTRYLEQELERTRTLYADLLDSLMVSKGLPPTRRREEKPLPVIPPRVTSGQYSQLLERKSLLRMKHAEKATEANHHTEDRAPS